MSLTPFFNPHSVAVIGASTNPKKLGYAVLENLLAAGFLKDGRKIYPINPKADRILGLQVYPVVTKVPGDIDLAIIVIPYLQVPDALRSCGEKGIPAVIVISAGFREAGKEGLERELELLQIAREQDIRVIGPNCLGVIDTVTPLNATFAAGMPPAGPMAFMSQSGALGTAILDWAQAGKIGMDKFVSLGNKADVSEIDLLRHWEDDPALRAILIYTEGLPDGQEFIRVAREVSKKKAIVVVKSGVTQAGSRAVISHTGSLAGSEQAYRAAFHQAGVIRAESMQDLFDYALAFGYLPPFKGSRIAIVTNAGGPGILATDALERVGLELAQFDSDSILALGELLPEAASVSNPIDVLGDARADRYEATLAMVSRAPNVDGVLVILTPQAMTEIEGTAQIVVEIAGRVDIPILGCFMGGARVEPGIQVLSAGGVPNFPYPERAAKVLKAMQTYTNYQARDLPRYETFQVDRATARRTIDQVVAEGRVTIGDAEARGILAAYGLRIPASHLADSADAAVTIADQIGYPVVLKIASPDILHKTDVGGVKVGLENPVDVRDAYDLITYRAQRYLPEARLWGCLVQEMVPQGLEVLIGMNRDPQFGPVVTFGLGGIYVETLKDVAFRISPFSRSEAESMLEEIRARALLEGVRGRPPVDRIALVDALLRIGQLVTDFPEIAELDVNPYVVYEEKRGGIAIDMRLILNPDAIGASQSPTGLM